MIKAVIEVGTGGIFSRNMQKISNMINFRPNKISTRHYFFHTHMHDDVAPDAGVPGPPSRP